MKIPFNCGKFWRKLQILFLAWKLFQFIFFFNSRNGQRRQLGGTSWSVLAQARDLKLDNMKAKKIDEPFSANNEDFWRRVDSGFEHFMFWFVVGANRIDHEPQWWFFWQNQDSSSTDSQSSFVCRCYCCHPFNVSASDQNSLKPSAITTALTVVSAEELSPVFQRMRSNFDVKFCRSRPAFGKTEAG